ncbi:MAG: HEAT repeat domain-containing protein [Microcoleaceae cyanobacterium]
MSTNSIEIPIYQFLTEVEANFQYIHLFHTQQPISLIDQYIPIKVNRERRYRTSTETTWSYTEFSEKEREWGVRSPIIKIDWEEAKKEYKKIIVLADPGMGKSTLLKREALITAQQEKQKLDHQQNIDAVILPIFIRLSELAIIDGKIIDRIVKLVQQNHTNTFDKIQSTLVDKLREGKCLLLLDGLDEVPKNLYNSLIEKLNSFTHHYPCQIILTSRIVGYNASQIENIQEVEIVPFSLQQTQQYIQAWFSRQQQNNKNNSISPDLLIQELENKPRINILTQNPFLLSLLCRLYQTQLSLPNYKTQVYQLIVDYALNSWRSDYQINDLESEWITTKKKLLANIAYQLSCTDQQIFSQEELREKIEQFIEKTNSSEFENKTVTNIINQFVEEDRIIQALDRYKTHYSFIHPTFQEYFTALYLSKAKNIALIKPFLWKYNHHESLTFLAGLMKNPIPLIKTITKTKDDIFKTQLLLAGRCISECRNVNHPVITRVIKKIYRFWIQHQYVNFIVSVIRILPPASSEVIQPIVHIFKYINSFDKARSRRALVDIKSEAVLNFLAGTLKIQSTSLKSEAAKALGQIGSELAVEPLIKMLRGQIRSNLSNSEIARTLGEIKSEIAVESLITALEDEQEDARKYSAQALGYIGSELAVEPLITTLNDDEAAVREEAAGALGKIGSEMAVNALITTLRDSNTRVSRSSVIALCKIGSELAIEHLITALSDEQSYVRRYAAEGLGKIGSPLAVKHLIIVLNDEDWYVGSCAAKALGKIGSPSAIKALKIALKSNNCWVRGSAAVALSQLGYEIEIDPLTAILGDEDWQDRYRCEDRSGLWSDKLIYSINDLEDKDWSIRSRAAEALGQARPEEAIEALIMTLKDEYDYVRGKAIIALGKIGSTQAVEPLIAYLQHEYEFIRYITAEALGRIGSDTAVEALAITLTDADYRVRHKAAEALGQIGSTQVLKCLQTASGDANSLVRYTAAKAMVQIKSGQTVKLQNQSVNQKIAAGFPQIASEHTVEFLIAALAHEKHDVRRAAKIALSPINVKPAIEALIVALGHDNRLVQYGAIEALSQINLDYTHDALVDMLWHENKYIACHAAQALGYIGSEHTVEALIETLWYENESFVYDAAAGALGRIGTEQAIEPLIAVLTDDYSYYGSEVEGALNNIGTAEVLKQLIQNPHVDIYDSRIFSIARQIAIRLNQKNSSFIPVYPKFVKSSLTLSFKHLKNRYPTIKPIELFLFLHFTISFIVII